MFLLSGYLSIKVTDINIIGTFPIWPAGDKWILAKVENVVTREKILRHHDENFPITADSTGKSPFLFLFLHSVKMMEFCSHDFFNYHSVKSTT